jgi:hypothetical protein
LIVEITKAASHGGLTAFAIRSDILLLVTTIPVVSSSPSGMRAIPTTDHPARTNPTPIRPFSFAGHSLFAGPCETFAANTNAVPHRLPLVQNEIKECVFGVDDDGAWRLVTHVGNHLPDESTGSASHFWCFDPRRRGRGYSCS